MSPRQLLPRLRLTRLLLCGCLLAPAAWAGNSDAVALLTHMKTLTAERDEVARPRRGVGAVPLDAAVFERLAEDRADLRVCAAGLTEIPVLLRRREQLMATTRLVSHRATITAFTPAESGPATLEATLPGNQHRRLHAIELSVPIRDFERLVTVAVSMDLQNWTEVATRVPIYDYTRFVDLRRTLITFDPVEARAIRLTISSITEEKLSPLTEITRESRGEAGVLAEFRKTNTTRVDFRIDAITARERRVTESVRKPVSVPVPLTAMSIAQRVARQESVITLQTRRQPVTTLTLASATANFSRRVVLEGRWEAGKGAWQPLARGTLSQISIRNHSSKSLTLSLPKEARCGEYRLVVHNQDSPPLDAPAVTLGGPAYECVFFLEHATPYTLYYGGHRALAPHYDIATVLARAPSYECKRFRLDDEQSNPDYRMLARTRSALSWRLLFGLAITIAVLGLCWVIIHMAKGIKLEPDS